MLCNMYSYLLFQNSNDASPNEYRKNVQKIIMYIEEKNVQY